MFYYLASALNLAFLGIAGDFLAGVEASRWERIFFAVLLILTPIVNLFALFGSEYRYYLEQGRAMERLRKPKNAMSAHLLHGFEQFQVLGRMA